MRPHRVRAGKLAALGAALSVALAAASLPALDWLAAQAFASTPGKGATYSGTTTHGRVPLTLKVSTSGRAVTAWARYAPLYCRGGTGNVRQLSTPVAVSTGGTFRATISYEYVPRHTITAQLLLIGLFTSGGAKGVARSIFPRSQGCSGATTFSAQKK